MSVTKQHILDEIRRTAAENGGAALGREAFEKQTGVRQSDWYGRFWARWGDALIEAGFNPNTLQGAFSEEHLLRQYAEFVREYGRVPTAGEARLKRRADPNFPSHGTFARFGSKSQLVERLHRFAEAHAEYAEVASICATWSPAKKAAPEPEGPSEDVKFGFVYLIRSGRHYKIGKTNAVGRRERELAIQLPDKAKTVHTIRTDDPAGIEAYWHNRFAAKRGNGEWFNLDPADVAAFKRRRFM